MSDGYGPMRAGAAVRIIGAKGIMKARSNQKRNLGGWRGGVRHAGRGDHEGKVEPKEEPGGSEEVRGLVYMDEQGRENQAKLGGKSLFVWNDWSGR